MPDTKITALAAITTVDPAADVLPIVDISDTSMAASGTTKKITSNQILGAGGTATLASATITGAFGVNGTANFNGGALAANLNGFLMFGSSGNTVNFFGQSSGFAFKESTGVNNLLTINTSGFVFYDGAGGTRMTLNSTGLGVGASPAAKLHVEGSGPQARFSTASAVDARHEYYRNGIREGLLYWDANLIGLYATQSSGELVLASANTIRVRINSAGDTISNVTATPPTLSTNRQMVFNLTSDTNLRISVRGSDGTTRTANITLA